MYDKQFLTCLRLIIHIEDTICSMHVYVHINMLVYKIYVTVTR